MKRRYKTAAGLLAGLLLCQNVYGASLKEPEIQAQAAVVMDMNSGEFLYEKNADEKFYPASIVKLLTAGGPGRSTTVLNTYLYEKAFKDFNAGGAAAIGVAILIIAMIMSFLQIKLGKED